MAGFAIPTSPPIPQATDLGATPFTVLYANWQDNLLSYLWVLLMRC